MTTVFDLDYNEITKIQRTSGTFQSEAPPVNSSMDNVWKAALSVVVTKYPLIPPAQINLLLTALIGEETLNKNINELYKDHYDNHLTDYQRGNAIISSLDAIVTAAGAFLDSAILSTASSILGLAVLEFALIDAGVDYLKSMLDKVGENIQNVLNGIINLLEGGGGDITGPGGGGDGNDDGDGQGVPPNGNQKADPIILDLDRDGVETISKHKNIFFDHNGDGFAENSGWVAPDDGLLVWDKNSDGKITSGAEIFGNNMLLENGTLAENGFQALAELDKNGDGVIDKKDDTYNFLQVWQDRNSNGIVDDGELMSLSDVGVESISTTYKNSNYIDKQGNHHAQVGTITYTDGKNGTASDIWLDTNYSFSQGVENKEISDEVKILPYIRGFGTIYNLRVAMTENSNLKNLIEQYISNPLAARESGLLDRIIFSWTGVDDIVQGSRGELIDAQVISALEMISGTPHINQIVTKEYASTLTGEYNRFRDYMEARLLAQTTFKKEFSTITMMRDSEGNSSGWNFTWFARRLEDLFVEDIDTYIELRRTFYHFFTYDLNYQDIRSNIDSNYIVKGSSVNDVLVGTSGNDIIAGGTGDDILRGNGGEDTYLFNRGDGKDTINNYHSVNDRGDKLLFGKGISAEDIILSRVNNHLVLNLRNSTDSVTISDYFSNDANGNYSIDFIDFFDGTRWDIPTIKQFFITGTDDNQTLNAYSHGGFIYAGGGNDIINGSIGEDWLYGEDGDDHLYGNGGNDFLVGGRGNDYLRGGSGSDTYLFNIGDGQDEIYNYSTDNKSIDTLLFGEGITIEDIIVQRDGSNLVLKFHNSTDQITVTSHFSDKWYSLDRIQFFDGTVWDIEKIEALAIAGNDTDQTLYAYERGSVIYAAGGNDIIYGNKGDDFLSGGEGDDYLNEGGGSNTYLFDRGDGQDVINNYSTSNKGIDILLFGDGISSEDVLLQRIKNDLILSHKNSNDKVTLTNYFHQYYTLEQIKFSDGTIWDITKVTELLKNPPTSTASAAADMIMLPANEPLLVSTPFTMHLDMNEALILSDNITPDAAIITSGQGGAIVLSFPNGDLLTQVESGFVSTNGDSFAQLQFADGTIWLPEDIQNQVDYGIPIPSMQPKIDSTSIPLLKQGVSQFLSMGDSDDDVGISMSPPLALSSRSASAWN